MTRLCIALIRVTAPYEHKFCEVLSHFSSVGHHRWCSSRHSFNLNHKEMACGTGTLLNSTQKQTRTQQLKPLSLPKSFRHVHFSATHNLLCSFWERLIIIFQLAYSQMLRTVARNWKNELILDVSFKSNREQYKSSSVEFLSQFISGVVLTTTSY